MPEMENLSKKAEIGFWKRKSGDENKAKMFVLILNSQEENVLENFGETERYFIFCVLNMLMVISQIITHNLKTKSIYF